jgi:hypothetical protein
MAQPFRDEQEHSALARQFGGDLPERDSAEGL